MRRDGTHMTKTTSTMMPTPALGETSADDRQLTRMDDLEASAGTAAETSLILRLATDPRVDVEKLKAILDMQKDVKAQQARAAFNRAFAAMQPEIPVIDETAKTDKTTYAPLEDIVEQIRPICQRHGFSFGWESQFPSADLIKVICTLTHVDGHERTSEFASAPDTGPGRNAIQSRASAVTYGQRYTIKSLLGIVTRKDDDDAERAGSGKAGPDRPHDFNDKMDDMLAVADEGTKALEAAWAKLPESYRLYANQMERARWEKIKVRAATVDRAKKR